jgi:predicted TIM-barrel fold metal-dependent hydrolase
MIIDADAHYTPPPVVFDHPDIQEWYQQYCEKKQHSYTNIDDRLKEFAALKIDHQVLNFMGISLNINYRLPKHVGRKVMQIYNEHLRQIVSHNSGFSATIWLALQDLPASLAELELRAEQNFFAVFLSETPAWGFMPEYDVLFAKIAKTKMPVYLHQTEINDVIESDTSIWAKELQLLKEIWPAHHFWKRTIASLIIGGTLDRYPDLKIVIAERGTNWVYELQDCMLDLGFADPMPYLRRNFWFTTEPEMPDFIEDAELLGWNRMLFATDWPHDRDMGGANSLHDVNTVESLPITAQQKDLLYFKNYLGLRDRLDNYEP